MSAGELVFDTRINAEGFNKDSNKLGSIVKGLGIFAIIEKGLSMISASMDAAISRYDSLNRFPKIMEQMGHGAEQAKLSMQELSDGIQGLPTTLDDITQSTQRLTITTGSLDTGTKSALALNNAFLASGASAEMASRGAEQYIQMLGNGKPDLQSWKTLQETMPYALQKTAEAFGYTGATAQRDFYEALKNGEYTMTDFNAKLIELNGGVNGFAEVAKTATGGIGTAMENLKNRTVIGLTAIIEAFDNGLSATKFKSIENIIVDFSVIVKNSLLQVAKVVGVLANNLDTLAPILAVSMVGFASYKLVTATVSAYQAFNTVLKASKISLAESIGMVQLDTVSHGLLTAALSNETTAQLVNKATRKAGMTIDAAGNLITAQGTVATAAETAAVLSSSGALTLKTVVVGLLSGSISIATAAQWLWNAAMAANPIGLMIILITALIAGLVGLVSWLGKLAYKNDEQLQQIDDMEDKQDELTTSIDENSAAYKKNMDEVSKNKAKSESLLNTLSSLVDENGKLTGSHDDLTQVIKDLNSQYTGLNLAYDEEKQSLSVNKDEIIKYVEAQNERMKFDKLQERRNQLLDQEAEIQAGLNEIVEQRNIIENDPNAKNVSKKLKDLKKLEKEYTEQNTQNATELQANNNLINNSNNVMAKNTILMYENSGKAMASDGRSIKTLAEVHSTTTDEIIADMKRQNITLDEWVERNAILYTKDGKSIEQVATRWGMSVDQVKSYMSEWSIDLDSFSTKMEDTHTKAGYSIEQLAVRWGISVEQIKSHMDRNGLSLQEWSDMQDKSLQDVINGYEAIPMKMDISLSQMIAVLKKNSENMVIWKDNLEKLSQVASQAVVDEMQRLGPASNSAIVEMLNSTDKLNRFSELINAPINQAAENLGETAKNPAFSNAGQTIGGEVGQGIAENEQLNQASQELVNNVSTQLNTAVSNSDFTGVGQSISNQIVQGVQSSNMAGIGVALTTAINNGVAASNIALLNMKNAFNISFTTMSVEVIAIVNRMLLGVNSQISANQPILLSIITTSYNIFVSTMNGFNTSIYNAAKNNGENVIKGISDTLKSGKQKVFEAGREVGQRATDGMVKGLNDGKQAVYNKADEIANNVAEKMRKALVVQSPSKVMFEIFNFVTLGMVKGLENKEDLLYNEVDTIVTQVSNRLSEISQEMADTFNQKMTLSIQANQFKIGNLPQFATTSSNANAGTVVNNYFEQTNISPTAASPSENSRNIQNLLKRTSWGIP